jgi:hypothetical protein
VLYSQHSIFWNCMFSVKFPVVWSHEISLIILSCASQLDLSNDGMHHGQPVTAPRSSLVISHCVHRVSLYCLFFYLSMGWSGTKSTITAATYWPILSAGEYCGAISGVKEWLRNRSTRRKPAPVPPRHPQIPHDLTWVRTRAVAVGSLRLTA